MNWKSFANIKSGAVFATVKEPTANEGRIIPVLFGTKILDAPHLLWYGDFSVVQSLGQPLPYGGAPSGNYPTTIAPFWVAGNYRLGMHLGYCYGPIDKITRIAIDDQEVWTGTWTGGRMAVSKILTSKGGIYGDIDICAGHKSQDVNEYLRTHAQSPEIYDDYPNFSGIFSIIAEAPTLGEYDEDASGGIEIIPWQVTTSRIHYKSDGTAQWYDAKAEIDGDMNPAHIIHEAYCDTHYGMGYDSSMVDEDALQDVADTLYDEGLGMSLFLDAESTVQDIIEEVEKTVGGMSFVDRTTGLLSFRLIRDDYVVASLPTIDDDQIESVQDIDRDTSDELPTAIRVKYWYKSLMKESSVTMRDTALATLRGGSTTEEIEMLGITTKENAAAAASREFLRMAIPRISIKFSCDYSVASMNIGDPFIFSCDDYNIQGAVFRVMSINVGSFTDRKVSVEAIEDVVQPFSSIFDLPEDPEWEAESYEAEDALPRVLAEMPVYFLRRIFSESAVQGFSTSSGIIMYTGAAQSEYVTSLAIKINDVQLDGYYVPAKAGLLSENIGKSDESCDIDISGVEEGDFLLIDDEIVYVSGVVGATFDIDRGCMDTVPSAHSEDAAVISLMQIATDVALYTGTVTGKISTRTVSEQLQWDDATEDSHTIDARHYKPIAPGNLMFDGEYWPAVATGPIMVTWEPRDRFSVDDVISFTDTGEASEAGVTYTVQLYDGGGLISEETGLTRLYTIIAPDVTGAYTITVFSVRDGIESFQKHYHIVYYEYVEPIVSEAGLPILSEDDKFLQPEETGS